MIKNLISRWFIVNVFVAITYTGVAQNNGGNPKASLSLKNNEDINEIINLGSNGFILKTAKGYDKNARKSKVYSYRADLTKRWEVSIPSLFDKNLENFIVGNQFSPYVYIIQMSTVLYPVVGRIIVTRVDSTGKSTLFQFNTTEEFDPFSRLALFLDKDAFYFAQMQDKTINRKIPAGAKRLVLFSMKHSSQIFVKMDTEIQTDPQNPEDDIQIEFLGNNDQNIFFGKKVINLSEKTTRFNLITINKNSGDIDNNFDIESISQKAPVPAENVRETFGSTTWNNDFEVENINYTNFSSTTMTVHPGCFGGEVLDLQNGYFYLYGFTAGKVELDKKGKPLYKINTATAGLYIRKYDVENGDLIAEYDGDLPAELIYGYITNPGILFNHRAIQFSIVDSIRVRFICLTRFLVNTMFINLNTKKINVAEKELELLSNSDFDKTHNKYDAALLTSPAEGNSEFIGELKKLPAARTNDYHVFGIFLGENTVVVRNFSFSENPRIEMQLFRTIR